MSTIQEPLTIAPNKKYALFPINPEYQDIWELYKRQCSSMWIPEEMDLAKDRHDFDNILNDDIEIFSFSALFFASLLGFTLNAMITARDAFAKVTSVSVTIPISERSIFGFTSSCLI